ncbi:MAG: 2OG-Fe(II) oxygenase [Xanthomonadales bacterium]|jgi:hypothetical protein|nr:2OG-Fe(II) oxygenase [Xanthomonadales bacterium]
MTDKVQKAVNSAVLDQVGKLADDFQSARPFRHVAIDDFFQPEVARELADHFPAFDEKLAMNENGEVGAKAVNEKVRELGPPWQRLDDLVQSEAFRDLISRITGVPHLQYDPHYFGGGTHENLHGQGLDAHVDFNFHPVTRQHRRLNLIVYLTEEWQDEWGGSIQLHKDPYLPPSEDEIAVVTPLFNRAVIFETNEHSWHGFPRIDLPEDKRHLSRRSFALYYYTVTRPADELGAEHSTIYVEQHLPEDLKAGEPLQPEQLQHIRNLVAARDQHLRRLYGNIKQLYTELNELKERAGLQPPPGIADEYPGRPAPAPPSADGAAQSPVADPPPAAEADTGEPPEAQRLGADLDRLKAELHQRDAVIRQLEHRVGEFESSTSWRVTKPLRALKRLVAGG